MTETDEVLSELLRRADEEIETFTLGGTEEYPVINRDGLMGGLRDVLEEARATRTDTAGTVGEEAADSPNDLAWQIANECWMHTHEKAKLAKRIREALATRREAGLEEAAKAVEALVKNRSGNPLPSDINGALFQAAAAIRALLPSEQKAPVRSDVTGREYHGDIDGDGEL